MIDNLFFYRWYYEPKNYLKSPFVYIWRTIENFCANIKEIIFWPKNIIIRGLYGYTETDTYNFDTYLATIIVGGLKTFKKNKHAYPCNCGVSNSNCNCSQTWDSILDKMIDGFQAGKELTEGSENPIKRKKFHYAMNLFHKYYFALWS